MIWGHWCSVLCVWGLVATAGAASYLPGNSYLLIDDGSSSDVVKASATVAPSSTGKSKTINLLSWAKIKKAPPHPLEKYERERHFGFWLDFAGDDTCLDTRGLVLVRTSLVEPHVTTKPCRVDKGEWYDPYTDETYIDAAQVQIDHLVPLKNAYISGAFAWNWKKRCAYFNFMANDFHLQPVESITNIQKKDKGPDAWLPPNPAHTCTYIAEWLKVKAIWNLMLSEAESQSISKTIKKANCPSQMFSISKADLNIQRKAIKQFENACPATPPDMERIAELRKLHEH